MIISDIIYLLSIWLLGRYYYYLQRLGVVMKMNFNLNLIQTQKLVMTPELKQAIEILQFNSIELNEFIQEEMLSNPVLQKETPVEETAVAKKEEKDLYDKIDWKDVSNDYRGGDGSGKYYDPSSEEINYDNFVASEETLIDYLLNQLQLTYLNKKDRIVAKYIIENTDENGYLDIDSDEVIKKFSIDREKYDEILEVIHSFEPFGVCSRNLKECLLIQIKVRGIDNDIVHQIIENYLDDVGNNRLSHISKAIGCTIEDVKDALLLIRDLEPKPGRIFSSARDVRYITPDVIVKKIEGEYVIIVSDSTAPKLRINSFYNQLVSDGEMNGNASDYINKKLISAFKLIKSIEQRRNTIYKVVKAIIEFQEDFFEKGTVHLKTLILKDVADQIGVHESTVSRAISGKYMQCPRGLFEIKYFFQSGVSSVHGDGVSAESIKTIIKEIIDNEDPHKPISDQNVSDELNKLGIKISRRTVAKYRDEMGILSTSKRKAY